MPSLAFCLQAFADQMLTKASQAVDMMDLQGELNQATYRGGDVKMDLDHNDSDQQLLPIEETFGKIEDEMALMFTQLLK